MSKLQSDNQSNGNISYLRTNRVNILSNSMRWPLTECQPCTMHIQGKSIIFEIFSDLLVFLTAEKQQLQSAYRNNPANRKNGLKKVRDRLIFPENTISPLIDFKTISTIATKMVYWEVTGKTVSHDIEVIVKISQFPSAFWVTCVSRPKLFTIISHNSHMSHRFVYLFIILFFIASHKFLWFDVNIYCIYETAVDFRTYLK